MRVLFCGFLLFFCTLSATASYTLDLKAENWKINPTAFYISEVLDSRTGKSDAGQVLISGKSDKAVFAVSLENDILKMFNMAIQQDTTNFPILISFQKFSLSETGTLMKHRAVLDYKIKFYSRINGTLYELFEVSGKPEVTASGTVPKMHEQMIETVLKNSIESFNNWINTNRNIPPLMRDVKVLTEKSRSFSSYEKVDTILWCPNEYKLQWKDFLGTAPESDFSAQSMCMFLFSVRPEPLNGTMNLYIQLSACFARTTSWVKTGVTSDTLLGHEQLHFDICELYIRKLRKTLMEAKLDPIEYQKQIQPLFDAAWVGYQKAQAAYDEETQHGLIWEEQFRWQNEIAAELIALKQYAVSTCD